MGEKQGKKMNLHAVCVPFPAPSHITPMLQLAKLLNYKGFHITFFHTEHSHRCLLNFMGPNSLDETPTFRFATFPDGLPPSENDLPRPIPALLLSLERDSLEPFVDVLLKQNETSAGWPPVTLIISDALIPFALEAAQQLPDSDLVYFTPSSPFNFIAASQYDPLLQRGILPFKDRDYMTNGCLDAELEPVPASIKGVRLKNLPSHIRTQDKNNPVFGFMRRLIARCSSRPIIFNTFEAMDHQVVEDLYTIMAGPIYTVGPLNAVSNKLSETSKFGSTFWKEEPECLQWLDSQKPNSVVYASFGTVTVMTSEQLIEFAWGLANSKHPFLWAIRPDLVIGDSAILPVEFENEIKGRGLIVGWCPQEKVLNHPATTVFLMQGGWNSTHETIMSGVPTICWPYKGDHQPISWWCCDKGGIGLELSINVCRDEVEKRIREVLETKRGTELKNKVMEWKDLAEKAINSTGSSILNIDRLIDYVLSVKC
ncbi:7-deoxyloganetin glucosyltransferase-like [Silene latifolia]|uniref:7-deoxyloganetin glucosyltransferase-like n=1 Tax=Silene latifolia TaxID=37657 RepID=UPI003D78A8DE